MPKLDLTRAQRIKSSVGDFAALKAAGVAWVQPQEEPAGVAPFNITLPTISPQSPTAGDFVTAYPGTYGGTEPLKIEYATQEELDGQIYFYGSTVATKAGARYRAISGASNAFGATPIDYSEWTDYVSVVGEARYLGAIATGGQMADEEDAAKKQFNARSYHMARDDITELQVKLPGWWWMRKTGSSYTRFREHNVTSDITYRCAIEYPEGVFTPLTFGGSRDGICTGGGTLVSDALPITIPDGAAFWLRTFYQCPWGIIYCDGDNGSNLPIDRAHGERFESAASGLADKTTSGTIPVDTNTYGPCFRPLAIIGQTSKPSILFIGDSRTWGFGENRSPEGYRGDLERAFGPHFAYANTGAPGETVEQFVSYGAKRAALQEHFSHVIIQHAMNSLGSPPGKNMTASAVLAEMQSLIAMFPDKVKWVTTTGPQSTSTDGWITLDNQTPDSNTLNIHRYNQAIRAGVNGVTGYIDINKGAEEAPYTNKWKVPGYTDEGKHMNANGYALAAAAIDWTVINFDEQPPVMPPVPTPVTPTLVTPIPDQVVDQGAATVSLNLDAYFRNARSYLITPVNSTVTIIGKNLVIKTGTVQNLNFTITAVSSTGHSATDALNVNIRTVANAPTVTTPIPDQSLTVGGSPVTLNLATYFANASSYTVSPADAKVTISGSTLTINPSAALAATNFTVTATGAGGSVSDTFALTIAEAVVVTPPTTVRSFNLNEGTGTTVSGGAGVTGTLSAGVVWEGNKLVMNGPNAAIAIPTNTGFFNGNLLMGMVLQLDNLNGAQQLFSYVFGSPDRVFMLRLESGPFQYVSYAGGTGTIVPLNTAALPVGRPFTLMAYVTTTTVEVFVDGGSINKATFPTRNTNITSGRDLLVGSVSRATDGTYLYNIQGDIFAFEFDTGATLEYVPVLQKKFKDIATAKGVTLP